MENKSNNDKEFKGCLIGGILVGLGLLIVVLVEGTALGIRSANNIADGGWIWLLVVGIPILLFAFGGKKKE